MRLHHKLFFLILISSNCFLTTYCQDVGFSQFYDQPLLRNPALAGIFTGDIRLVSSYRNQWQSVTVPYRTFALSGEFKLPAHIFEDDNITIGLQLIKDIAGTSEYSTLQILPAANYSFPLSGVKNSYLSFGVMGGLMQQRFDPTKLVLNDQFVSGTNGSFSLLPSSRQVFNNTSMNYIDLSTGLSYSGVIGENTDFYVGAGIFHITKKQVGFFSGSKIIMNKKLAFNVGLSTQTSETDQLILYGDYFKQYGEQFKPVGSGSLQVGMIYSHDLFVQGDEHQTIAFGVLYRLEDAVIPVLQLQLSNFTIGTSYDVNVSKLAVASQYRGGFELTLSYTNFLNALKGALRQSLCPRFGNMPSGRYNGYR